MPGWCVRWWNGGSSKCVRLLVTMLCWGTLMALALSGLQPLPKRCAPPARAPATSLLLQSPRAAVVSILPPPALPIAPLPTIDVRVFTEHELRADIERRLPSLPLAYWHRHKYDKNKYYKIKKCAPFPSIFDLEFHNTYWQTLHSSVGDFYLYGVYMDARNATLEGPAVRLLAVHDRMRPRVVTYCQLWFEEQQAPVLVRNLEYKYLWVREFGNNLDRLLQPFLLTCMLPINVRHLVPASVSLVENACDRATNNLRVLDNRLKPPAIRKEFAVCVKGLDFQHKDISVHLVEWIEFVRLLGADKIFFYELQVHTNITKVLDYYTSLGVTTVTPMTLPGGQPNLPGLQHMYLNKKTMHKQQMELIPNNDCLYRHMYEYRWLALLDIDEVIVPVVDADWSALMRRVLPLSIPPPGEPPRSSYHASNLYFLDSLRLEHGWEEGVLQYMRNFSEGGYYSKAFHETDMVLALRNNLSLACLGGESSSYVMKAEHARLQPYRADCNRSLRQSCGELLTHTIWDKAMWRWRDSLVARVEAALRALAFLPPAPPAAPQALPDAPQTTPQSTHSHTGGR